MAEFPGWRSAIRHCSGAMRRIADGGGGSCTDDRPTMRRAFMPTVPTDRRPSVQSIILLLVSFARRVLWTSIGALVTSPVPARAKPRPRSTRRHRV
jgi:hypothetical protein